MIIAVPEAEELVKPFRDRFDGSAVLGVPAHITVLFPFAEPPDIDEASCDRLATLFESVGAFRFVLSAVRRFVPANVLYLAPEPDEQFRALTHAIVEAFPHYPPYGGVFADPVPHLTVAQSEGLDEIAAEFDRASQGHLPIAALAEVVTLMVQGEDGWWRDHRSFRLGGSR